jgi:hypothetical protein
LDIDDLTACGGTRRHDDCAVDRDRLSQAQRNRLSNGCGSRTQRIYQFKLNPSPERKGGRDWRCGDVAWRRRFLGANHSRLHLSWRRIGRLRQRGAGSHDKTGGQRAFHPPHRELPLA